VIEIFGNREERLKLTEMYIQQDGTPYGEDKSLMSDIVQAKPKLHLPKNFT
jgi:hypothetical protein